MLPFLKREQSPPAGLNVKIETPDASEDQDDPKAAHLACAHEILQAVKANSPERLAEALKDIFNILDSEPHEEGEHIEPHSYEAQKED